jgi:NDP-sugar pyrophosphorylase family protein
MQSPNEKSQPKPKKKEQPEDVRIAPQIDTSGGAYVGGDVSVGGGDFVGRDTIHGDIVHGDKVTVGDIAGSGVAFGQGVMATVAQGVSREELAHLFQAILDEIEILPQDPDVDKEELIYTVRKIQKEVAIGENANPNKIERWLMTLGLMSPDVLRTTVAVLANPGAGVAYTIRRVAKKALSQNL